MIEQTLTPTTDDWHEQVAHLQAELDALLPQLVEAETELAERHAAINAFEFRLRTAVNQITQKLDVLDAEIRELRHKLRWHGDEWYEVAADDATAWARGQSATDGSDYRYRDTPTTARPVQDEDTRAELKRLYRQLARRFHPDMAVDTADREYRTQMMMAINGAYAAGDLEKLQELVASPEAAQALEYADANQKLAETLLREVTRMQRRLAEIQKELTHLEKHESAKMMQQMTEAAANGRDYFTEIQELMGDVVAERTAVRDSLLVQLESVKMGYDVGVSDDELADIVANVTLETSFDADISAEFDRYIIRRRDQFYREDNYE
ncbi:MAG: hypothetical protein GY796_06365 [Chloroflexi bacterium]|nr:hypothetical protein [Chloroflexota bacterium]